MYKIIYDGQGPGSVTWDDSSGAFRGLCLFNAYIRFMWCGMANPKSPRRTLGEWSQLCMPIVFGVSAALGWASIHTHAYNMFIRFHICFIHTYT